MTSGVGCPTVARLKRLGKHCEEEGGEYWTLRMLITPDSIQASHPRCHLLLDVQKVVDDKEIVLLEKCLLCLHYAAIDHSSLLVLWQK